MNNKKHAIAVALSTVFALSACGGGSSSSSNPTPTPTEPTNSAPTDITLSNSSVNENEAGATIGQLTATDADSGDTFTFTVEGDMFIVDGAELKLAEDTRLNFDVSPSHTVNITVTDNGGLAYSEEFTIDVNDTNSAPTDISLSNNSVQENEKGALVGELSASDFDADDSFTYTVDSDLFEINGVQLKLVAETQLNYEAATSHTVNVTVTDNGGATYTKELTVDVTDMLDTYTFTSKFTDGSSVSYSGQVARHALINELNYYIGTTLKTEVLDGTITSRDQVLDKLDRYFRTSEEQYDNFELKSFGDNAVQKFMTDISGSVKRLGGSGGKIAGRDEKGQHKDWGHSEQPGTGFVGWGNLAGFTPEDLVDMFFGQLADNVDYYLTVGNNRVSDSGEIITEFYINTDGTDLKQLIQKFLLMSVAYSQSTDDYFGSETVDVHGNDLTTDENCEGGKGLQTCNEVAVDGKNYSNLEHQFDEGFGYFGAARDYLEYTDNEIAGSVEADGSNGRVDWNGKHDTNGDGMIDLLSEYNFGNSVNAAKRDRKAVVATDYTNDAMTALIAGRNLINVNSNSGAPLTEAQMTELLEYRNRAVRAWENGVAATVVHYINDSHDDLELLRTDSADYSYSDLAKHWSELKGFALGLQFNPYSPLSDEDFATFHELVGQRPVMDADGIADYQAKLIQARDILEAAYEFNAENVANW